ncbi:PAS domain-containing hybrid sensor histidine kinase/response regulator [Reyranella sp.]|uniref:PAS domain-containing hybrid sensor histidine kinase/response regulator n=1 Tax=Reyranella sp. TaxID=1929291 RepID=UPI002731FFC2|nr:PAS domain-containing hybrid sensor histidine kinase/response regulator [Reyranella sp.]MDP2378601.1 response regulator [Reyranella sp.]
MNNIDREGLVQLFMASLPGAVALLDVDGNVLTWSTGARDITGYAADEIEGRHFSCLYTRDDNAAGKPAASLGHALAAGRHEETGRRVRKDGTEFEVCSMFMPLHDSKGALVGFSSLMRNTTSSIGAAADAPPPGLAPRRGRETILVVDDDEQVREIVSHQLTSLGYETVVASNGPEALEMLAREPHVDLLLTDVVMPGGMNGREVAEAARRMQPNLKVLFTSGYFEGALLNNGKIDASAQLLVKPYRKNRLAEKVLEALRSAA